MCSLLLKPEDWMNIAPHELHFWGLLNNKDTAVLYTVNSPLLKDHGASDELGLKNTFSST